MSKWQKYIKRIRNPQKRVYAYEYAMYTLHGGQVEPARGSLSYMAAQAVRMELTRLFAES